MSVILLQHTWYLTNMKILLTGATGYIGKRLLPVLIKEGHEVVCCVRDSDRFKVSSAIQNKVTVIENDLLDLESLSNIPNDIDGAYYLVHSMSASADYQALERTSASNFRHALNDTNVKHIVYLSGIVNESELSHHLESRKTVELELGKGNYNFTTLRAGIIVGSGSSSFEILRDLVEKLPLMVAPKWLKTRCQPIAISDVISFLYQCIFNEKTYNQNFDIGGPDILSYQEMLLEFGQTRGLKRWIYTVPVMTPRISSYWLYFVTATSYKLAVALVNSMKVEVICRNKEINQILGITPISYQEAINNAFRKIESNEIVSSWKDAYASSNNNDNISNHIKVPTFGCFKDHRTKSFVNKEACVDKLWKIGGETGWYSYNWLWRARGLMDKIAGGVGLRRGRTSVDKLNAGDALDFWRVLYANKDEGRLLLYAEMKLPGEAWLEFNIVDGELAQTATFRPLGVSGRLYWFSVLPFHNILFNGMIRKLTQSHD